MKPSRSTLRGIGVRIRLKTLSEVRAITEEWMDQYNEGRPHDALDDLTPFEYRVDRITYFGPFRVRRFGLR